MIKQVFKTMVAFLAVATMTIGPAWGQNSSTSSLVFESSCGGSGTANDNVVWTVTSDGTESNYDGTKGIHYGTSKAQVQYIQLSTSGIEGTITKVKVNASTASGVNNATVGVTVGGNAFGGNAQSLSINATDYTFTGSASGAIVVRVEKPSAANGALYVKSIEVTYTPASSGGGSGSETPTPGQNQQLTVHDVSSSTNVTPINGGYANQFNKCEMVYPASELAAMNGSVIKGLTFYSSTEFETAIWGAAQFQVFLREVANATISSYYGTTGATVVYEGSLSFSGDRMTVTFSTPYTYQGGNLLVGVYQPVIGTDATVFWYADVVTGASLGGRSATSLDGVTASVRDWLPKTTFSYGPAPTPHTVRMAAGTEEAANWTLASGNASVPGTQVLGNVMSGSQVTATYNGTTKKVKSVKAVKYVVPPTPLDNTTTAWTAGTFAVPAGGLTYSAAITVSGDVTLTLTDGTTLTLNKGISLASGATLTIQGNGTMNVNGTNESTASTVAGTGTITLTSGTLTARGGNGGSVDIFGDGSHGGNGGNAINGSVIVSGGTLTARGGNGGSVGEVSIDCSGGNGGVAISGTLTINGGSTSVNNGSNGSIGEDCDNCTAGAGGKAVAGTVTDNR